MIINLFLSFFVRVPSPLRWRRDLSAASTLSSPLNRRPWPPPATSPFSTGSYLSCLLAPPRPPPSSPPSGLAVPSWPSATLIAVASVRGARAEVQWGCRGCAPRRGRVVQQGLPTVQVRNCCISSRFWFRIICADWVPCICKVLQMVARLSERRLRWACSLCWKGITESRKGF
jgi:hypothetical protein